ncbi:plasmid mobilization relaxosome protein MobC [Variovorax sp. 2RAF20]|uniref:plasmid mobilization protein n=1 Tax=Variovorax sp. CF313 TaxID=1144315 RepID=UPI0005B2C1F3|nr:plasmid mobilization relaxosome protein MobC [Variovorax sp. CF313]
MSRPLTFDEPLDDQVKVRLTVTEGASVRRAAAASGGSLSDFLRACLTSGGPDVRATGRPAPRRRQPDLSKRRYTQVDPALLFQLSQLGNSVNQIAHRLNAQYITGTPVDVLTSAKSLKQIELSMQEILHAHLR